MNEEERAKWRAMGLTENATMKDVREAERQMATGGPIGGRPERGVAVAQYMRPMNAEPPKGGGMNVHCQGDLSIDGNLTVLSGDRREVKWKQPLSIIVREAVAGLVSEYEQYVTALDDAKKHIDTLHRQLANLNRHNEALEKQNDALCAKLDELEQDREFLAEVIDHGVVLPHYVAEASEDEAD